MAMLARDAHVARRNTIQLFLQTFLQPLLFVFIFGRVMVGSGYLPPAYKSLLLPGIIAISMVFTGIWAVAMPLIAEFQWTREIEDRLLAPIDITWISGRAKSKTACLLPSTLPGSQSKKSLPACCRPWLPGLS